MTTTIKVDEMLDVLRAINSPLYKPCVAAVEAIGTMAANEIAAKLNINCGAAKYEGADLAGTCATFWPLRADQPCPPELESFDDPNEWRYYTGSESEAETSDSEFEGQFTREDWQREVANGDTSRGFEEWRAAQIEMMREGI